MEWENMEKFSIDFIRRNDVFDYVNTNLFLSYRYMAEVLSLGWILHLSSPMILLMRLLGMVQYALVLVNPIMAILKAIQFVKSPYEKKIS